jgi:hypothetical protein
MKPFERWKYEELELTFGIERLAKSEVLEAWLASDSVPNDFELQMINWFHTQLLRKVDAWNEDELKYFFIAPLIGIVNFSRPKVYSSFSQRTLSAVKKDVHQKDVPLRGRVEFFVALGEQIPRQPFFFLHEYKPQNKTTPSDPLGQLLVAMLATQVLNEHQAPLYGVYVSGKDWYFVTLENEKYAVSGVYNSTQQPDLLKIFAILKQCKIYIEDWIDSNLTTNK